MSLSESNRAGVIAGGNWIVDRVKMVDSWPPQDSLANIRSESQANGGSPYNVLKNLSKLKATFPLEGIGLIGEDASGELILADCLRHGIDTKRLRRMSGGLTSYTDVMTVQDTGRRTFFHQRGTNAFLAPEHFDFTKTRAKFFHLGYILLLDGLDKIENGVPLARNVLRQARVAGLRTSLDCVSENTDRFKVVVLPVLPEVDILFANDFEAEKLTGIPLRKNGLIQKASVENAARELLAQGVRQWVILHFPEAAYAVTSGDSGYWQPSFEIPAGEVKGVAGAGDAFASGILYALHFGWNMRDSLRLAVSAAASSLLEPTCSDGILGAMECMRLDERWKFRLPLL